MCKLFAHPRGVGLSGFRGGGGFDKGRGIQGV